MGRQRDARRRVFYDPHAPRPDPGRQRRGTFGYVSLADHADPGARLQARAAGLQHLGQRPPGRLRRHGQAGPYVGAWPAVKINVRHSEQTGNATNFESECRVTLHGHPGADKLALINLAARIIEDRLGKMKDLAKDNQSVAVSYGIIDTIGERNEMDMWLKIQHSLGWFPSGTHAQPQNYLATPIGKLGRPLGLDPTDSLPPNWGYTKVYDPTVTPVPSPWGYNTIQKPTTVAGEAWRSSFITNYLLWCFLQNPCDNNHWMPKTIIPPVPNPTPTLTPTGTTGTNDKSPPGPPGYPPQSQGPASATVTSSANIPPMTYPEQVSSLADAEEAGVHVCRGRDGA